MKLIRTIIFLFFAIIPTLISHAGNIEPGWYILAGAGFSQTIDPSLFNKKQNNPKKIKFFTSPVVSANLGYKINRFFRADINAQKIKSPTDLKALRLTNYVATINAYLDLNNHSPLTPYMTAARFMCNSS